MGKREVVHTKGQVVADENIRDLIISCVNLQNEIDLLNEDLENKKAKVIEYITENGNAEFIVDNYGEKLAQYSCVASCRLDTSTFKKAEPILAEQYTKFSESMRLVFNKEVM